MNGAAEIGLRGEREFGRLRGGVLGVAILLILFLPSVCRANSVRLVAMAKSAGTPPDPTASPAGPAAGASVDVAALLRWRHGLQNVLGSRNSGSFGKVGRSQRRKYP